MEEAGVQFQPIFFVILIPSRIILFPGDCGSSELKTALPARALYKYSVPQFCDTLYLHSLLRPYRYATIEVKTLVDL
jgi:hypothetical protein